MLWLDTSPKCPTVTVSVRFLNRQSLSFKQRQKHWTLLEDDKDNKTLPSSVSNGTSLSFISLSDWCCTFKSATPKIGKISLWRYPNSRSFVRYLSPASRSSIVLGLRFVEARRLYRISPCPWIVCVDAIKQLETNVEVLIECVKQADVVLFRTMKPLDQRDCCLSLPI